MKQMSRKYQRFVSAEDDELKRIKERKLKELTQQRENKQKMITKPAHVTDATFNKAVQENKLAIIDCWASWCGPCMVLAPTIDALAEEYAGKVFIGKLDVDENPKTAEQFQVFSIPTLLVMKDGVEVDRVVGLCQKNYIEDKLKKHL
jgi:thioredoxin 1